MLGPVHPGEILLEDFIKPLGLSQMGFARAVGLKNARLHSLIRGRTGLTADIAIALSEYFGNSPMFWMNLQVQYDLRVAMEKRNAARDQDRPA